MPPLETIEAQDALDRTDRRNMYELNSPRVEARSEAPCMCVWCGLVVDRLKEHSLSSSSSTRLKEVKHE